MHRRPSNSSAFVASPVLHHNRRLGMSQSAATTASPIQYRVEERRRTIYITSTVPPSEWKANTVDELLRMADSSRSSTDPASKDAPVIIVQNQPTSAASSPKVLRKQLSRNPMAANTGSSGILLEIPKDVSRAGSPRGSPKTPERPKKILFYHKKDPYYGFTNFSAHPVVYQGKRYPTSEHLFQSFKFHEHRPLLAEHIRTCSDHPSVAFSEARRFQPEARRDWMNINIEKMEEAIYLKFTQHPSLKRELLSTGDAELVEDSDKDAFWGIGADGKGRNELGKALVRLRSRLREEES